MAIVTPIQQSALRDLQTAVQVADVYADQNIAASSAQEQLPRIRGLIMVALAKLSEPNGAAIAAAQLLGRVVADGYIVRQASDARDTAAAILHAALTGEVAGEKWMHSLPCPGCNGAEFIGKSPCEDCKGTGSLR